MKILFVVESLAGGGAERVVTILASQMTQNADVGVLSIRSNALGYALSEQVQRLFIGDISGNRLKRMYERMVKTRKMIRSFNPDAIIAFDTFANIYAIMCSVGLKCKVIVSERNDPNSFPTQKSVRRLRNLVYHGADGVVFQTKDAMEYFHRLIQKRSSVIPNPVNQTFIGKMYKGERKKKIVTVCRLNPQKNLRLFVDIVAEVHQKYPQFIGVIFGEGPEKEVIQEYIKQKKMEEVILLAGQVKDVLSNIQDAYIYLCTSNFEGISNSILEAMTVGVPVVATDCPIGGTRMMIDNGANGLLFPTNNVKKGTEAVLRLIEDEDLCRMIMNSAPNVADEWSPDNICKRWLSYVDAVLRKKRK